MRRLSMALFSMVLLLMALFLMALLSMALRCGPDGSGGSIIF